MVVRVAYALSLQHFRKARVIADAGVENIDAGVEELHAGAKGGDAALEGVVGGGIHCCCCHSSSSITYGMQSRTSIAYRLSLMRISNLFTRPASHSRQVLPKFRRAKLFRALSRSCNSDRREQRKVPGNDFQTHLHSAQQHRDTDKMAQGTLLGKKFPAPISTWRNGWLYEAGT